ncbi:MAG: hypothetical protein AAF766_20860 [Cyanobacteria bacterium P01_D01_bin.14]
MFKLKHLLVGLLIFLVVACSGTPNEPVTESPELPEITVEESTAPAQAELTDLDSLFEAHRWQDRVLLVFGLCCKEIAKRQESYQ